MKTFFTFIFAATLFFTISGQNIYSGRVSPLRAKGAGPASVQELYVKLQGNGEFLHGVTSGQWLGKVAEGLNYGAAKGLGFNNHITNENVMWFVKNAAVVATQDLGVGKDDYLSSGSASGDLLWIKNPNIPDSLLVYLDESGKFLILAKWDCLNPVCDLRGGAPVKETVRPEPVVTTYQKPVQVEVVIKHCYRDADTPPSYISMRPVYDCYGRVPGRTAGGYTTNAKKGDAHHFCGGYKKRCALRTGY